MMTGLHYTGAGLGKVCQGEINSRVAAKSFDVRARLWTADFGMEEFRKVYEFALLRWEKVARAIRQLAW